MILPNAKVKQTKSAVRKLWDSWWSGEGDDPTAITVPDPIIMRSQCMEIHLKPTKDLLLKGKFSEMFAIQNAINGCISLFQCVYVQWVEHRGSLNKWRIDAVNSVSIMYF